MENALAKVVITLEDKRVRSGKTELNVAVSFEPGIENGSGLTPAQLAGVEIAKGFNAQVGGAIEQKAMGPRAKKK